MNRIHISHHGYEKLDKVFLALVNCVKITDTDFLALKIEDPFFGRMTDIKDVIE